MTSLAQKNSGFLLPETIYPEQTICVQFEIPDTPEYRQATKGLVSMLGQWWMWEKSYAVGDTRASQAAQLFRQLIIDTYQEGCMSDCENVIDCMEANTDYIGLNSTIYSQSLASTQQYASELEAEYDDTPQSIGADIPVGVPDTTEQGSLCYALQSYLELFAATKSANIQQKNNLQIAWTRIRAAQNKVFNSLIDILSPIYEPNLFNCWVDDSAALTALADETALETVACCILDELESVAMSETAFNGAITACAMSLTGTEGDIACLLSNENDLQVYLMFLEAYNVALENDLVECPCTVPETTAEWDFKITDGGFVQQSGGGRGVWVDASGWETQLNNSTQGLIIYKALPENCEIEEVQFDYEFTSGTWSISCRLRDDPNSISGQVTIFTSSSVTTSPNCGFGSITPANRNYLVLFLNDGNNGSISGKITKVRIRYSGDTPTGVTDTGVPVGCP